MHGAVPIIHATPSVTVLFDAVIHTPTPEPSIHSPQLVFGKAATAIIAKGCIVNPIMCRMKQLPKKGTTATQELEVLCVPIGCPFHAPSDI
ncbi:LOW QUALITY PROTEIN: hypothetical protein PHMEG_00028118 [Phytophthora megakarya]|uniref:Uncharacterized protein n=1 Tax=Phytophthora megakarya TaxID=4795 RepID=A0A225V5P5_9STRA|nr:LOW QUALITY PROTEIN: hypothetical protein PHMEG_00028118 [Phytophthora megakarya]